MLSMNTNNIEIRKVIIYFIKIFKNARCLFVNKSFKGITVLSAARKRISWTFDTFRHICVSFSGGKDSTVLLHLVAESARRQKRKISVLFIDWEAQFSLTIEHIEKMKHLYADVIDNFYWVALPMTTVSGVSQHEPEWVAWAPGAQWVRKPPHGAITDESFFSFYKHAMTFEEFIPAFSRWLTKKNGDYSQIILVGIRADESLHRMMAISSHSKLRYADDKPWTTASVEGTYYTAYPLYDWKASDIWTYCAKENKAYNSLYDLMYQAGVPLGSMRVCEPFGPEQRRGLWLYHVLEPDTWERMCYRVAGANSGACYGSQSGEFFALHKSITKPEHHTWESYAYFLLESMPEHTAEHYRNKLAIYLKWYLEHDWPHGIPDEQEKDLGCKDIPSWRRICKTLIRNDFWCQRLSFSPNAPRHYKRYLERIKQKRQQWGII